jgi:hypothetical protein
LHGPAILARTLSVARPRGRDRRAWQYHSRSDHHSKVACWGVVFDLLVGCPAIRRHAEAGRVGFAVNREIVDFRNNRKKKLDLVLGETAGRMRVRTFAGLAEEWDIRLDRDEKELLAKLPEISEVVPGSVRVAVEAKACMTEFGKAIPRLHDELNSSHLTVHGAYGHAIAAAHVLVNAAPRFLGPDRNRNVPPAESCWNAHRQPDDARRVVEALARLPRRGNEREEGYDAVGIVVLECANDGTSVRLVTGDPAPAPGSIFHHDQLIRRIAELYVARFGRGG